MDFESALQKIGEFGFYQKILLFVVNIIAVPVYMQNLVAVFVAAQPKWTCRESKELCNEDGLVCEDHVYSSNFTSISTEWDLVCGSAYQSELAQSLYMAGSLLGGLVLGSLSDKYGRKKLWSFCVVATTVFGILSAFSPTLSVFLFTRFINGIFAQGVGLVTFVLATEPFGAKYRAFAGMTVQVFFAISLALFGWIAYMIRQWRMLLIAIAAPQIVSFFFLGWVPESPRWLLTKGRIHEVEEILHEAALANGIKNPKIKLEKLGKSNEKSSETGNYGVPELFYRKSIQMRSYIVMLAMAANGLVYYGLSINVKNLGGNVYVNFVLASLVEIPSYLVSVPLIERLGRRKTTFMFTFGTAIACWCCMKYQQAEVMNSFMISTTAMIGKFCASAVGSVLYTYAAELFPTVVRNMALGMCSVAARIGAIVAPFVVMLGNENTSLPMLIFAVFSLVAALVGLKLPETKGQMMPETFEDIEKVNVKGIHQLKSTKLPSMSKSPLS